MIAHTNMTNPIITHLLAFVWIYSQHKLMIEVLPRVSKHFLLKNKYSVCHIRTTNIRDSSLFCPARVVVISHEYIRCKIRIQNQ